MSQLMPVDKLGSASRSQNEKHIKPQSFSEQDSDLLFHTLQENFSNLSTLRDLVKPLAEWHRLADARSQTY